MNTRIAVPVFTSALALTLGACAGVVEDESVDLADDRIALDALFEDAGEEFGVPPALLKAVSFTETGWEMVEGLDTHHEGQEPAYGVMALRGDRLVRGAQLAGVAEDDVRFDEHANIRAAAALLDDHARALDVQRDDLADWAIAVGEYSGIEDEDARRHYVTRGVYDALAQGVTRELEGGHVVATLSPHDVVPDYPLPEFLEHAGTADYPSSVWRPSPNNSARSSGAIGKIAMVIIHTCEGSYAGCWGWLRNTAAGASAHYVVSGSGGEITQLVREARKAWHIAANYSCSNNSGVDCWRNGYNSNNFTVGIEHAGFASQSSFPSGQIEASAKLVCDITKDHGIPRDRHHIVGHGQLQPWNRTDPGKNWPWNHYINRVRAHCGSGGSGGGGGGGLIVDSNNANNDASRAKVEVSGNWSASAYSPGYYGTGYYWAETEAVSDAATFWFYLDSPATKTIDAWWVAGANRSAGTPFVAFDASGKKLGSTYRNQQKDGKRWNTLGTWNFSAGWNKVVVSRWAAPGQVVVADAIRVR